MAQREKKITSKQHEANKARSRKPRGRWANTAERAALEEAKRLLREGLPEGARRILEIIRDPSTPADVMLQAFKIAADRAGLPVLTQTELMGSEGREFHLRIDGGLGWPQVGASGGAGGGGGRDARDGRAGA